MPENFLCVAMIRGLLQPISPLNLLSSCHALFVEASHALMARFGDTVFALSLCMTRGGADVAKISLHDLRRTPAKLLVGKFVIKGTIQACRSA